MPVLLRRSAGLCAAGAVIATCGLHTPAGAATVGSLIDAGCSTEVVVALSEQIAAEVDCLMPGQLVEVPEGNGLVFTGGAVLPYFGEDARDDLLAAAAEGELQINSAYRSVAQQYLIVQWFQDGRCGITAAAAPGTSNHESGRAVDVANWSQRIASLEAHGWAQTVPGDEVHFDHLGSPDLRGSDVLAFQRLWNRNHPEDPIDEDGDFGPATEARLFASPAEGFAIGETCDAAIGGWPRPLRDPRSDNDDDDDPDAAVGGCSAGGERGGLALVLVVLVAYRGRRTKNVIVGPPSTSC